MKVNWTIQSGTYSFDLCERFAQWNEVAGIYMFTAPLPGDQWRALYVGMTENFRQRMTTHPQWDAARQLGATHVCALVVPQAAMRTALESALIRELHPPLNQQGRDPLGPLATLLRR